MLKIALVELGPWREDLFIPDPFLEPLGLESIAACVSSEHRTRVFQQGANTLEGVCRDVARFEPDVVGISLLTAQVPNAIWLASELKKGGGNRVIVVGGPHASLQPSVVAEEAIDFAVVGEGEVTFRELMAAIDRRRAPGEVPGLAWWEGKLRLSAPRARVADLDILPNPVRDPCLLQKGRIYTLTYPPADRQVSPALIQYSRGCGYRCSFCASPVIWGKGISRRSPWRLVEEIADLTQTYGTNYVSFVDLTFNQSARDVYEVCGALERLSMRVNWFAECRVDTDAQVFSAMAKAGCAKVAFGIECPAEPTLQRLHKHHSADTAFRCLEAANHAGLITKAFLMFGYPWEGKESIAVWEDFLRELPADEIRLTFFTPFPGTALFAQLEAEGLIATHDLALYDTAHPVMRNPDMDAHDLIEARAHLLRVFYTSERYCERLREKLRRFPRLVATFHSFFDLLAREGVTETPVDTFPCVGK
jgi:radical SAM superfamily enzyme YgiQ (UPF0313 family)